MKKLVAATAFATVALAAQSAAACDWDREASTEQQTVATTAAPAPDSPDHTANADRRLRGHKARRADGTGRSRQRPPLARHT